MKQQKVQIGALQEYPGTTVWREYAYECPECRKTAEPHGSIFQFDADGDKHYLCKECGEKAEAEFDDNERESAREERKEALRYADERQREEGF